MPGYWADEDDHDFPFLSFYSRFTLRQRALASDGLEFPDIPETVEAMGIMASFAWLNGLASFHGFTPFQELTYPFTTQTIVTDGQKWNFFNYQLNTHTFHSDFDHLNRKTENVCWSTGELKLFDSISDGKLVGINDQVIDNLIKVKNECNFHLWILKFINVLSLLSSLFGKRSQPMRPVTSSVLI